MSGHNKWSKIKSQKEVTDAKKGRLYTLFAKKISQAVKENRGLEAAVNQAKAASVPKDVIERAIERSKKSLEGAEEAIYDVFFLNGRVAILIKTCSDNHARTAADIRHLVEKHGGKMGAAGSATYLFTPAGCFYVENTPENLNLILESGAKDFKEEGDKIEVITEVANLENVAEFFSQKNIEVEDKEIIYEPLTKIELAEDEQKKVENLLSSALELDEVVSCFTTANI